MEITWLDKLLERRDANCPVCGSTVAKPAVLHLAGFIHRESLTLLECPTCTSLFYDDLTIDDYETLPNGGLLERYYLEQGVGLDWIVRLLYGVERHRVHRFLEVGCGYGVALDYASRLFGWEVKGVDPSPIAAMGRATLGVDIESRYIQSDERLEGPPYDLVLCSEVIEHVPDPLGFVAMLRGQMASDGALLLTTPNARTVTPGSPALLAVLSVGQHLLLFTKESLEGLLRQAGFQHVTIEESRDSLRAFASNSTPGRPYGDLNVHEFRTYLAQRVEDFPASHPLALGYRYRLFKSLVNEGHYAEADEVFQAVAPVIREAFGFELAEASAHLARLREADYLNLDQVPINLTGWLFFKGIIELCTNLDRTVSASYFDAALQAGLQLRHVLAQGEVEDGEIENLLKLARLHSIFCLADSDLELGKAELARAHTLPFGLAERYERQWDFSAADRAEFEARFAARYPQAQEATLSTLVAGEEGPAGSVSTPPSFAQRWVMAAKQWFSWR